MNDHIFFNPRTKAIYVRKLFSQIAPNYDLINKVITLGQIQKWRKKLINIADPPPGGKVLDLCSGTGKVTRLLAEELNSSGKVIGVDFCPEMISIAQKKITKKYHDKINFKLGDAMCLDFPDDYFNVAVIAFGLRNVANINQVIQEMKRVVKPGGKILCLDLSEPRKRIFNKIYNFYFEKLVPLLGKSIHGNKEPYAYLPASLKHFLNQEELKLAFQKAGLKNVNYEELAWGITAIHQGIKS